MPGGVLGYDGSINFSATDVLASLRKLDALKPDVVLPGHGADGDPGPYIAAGIDVGVHVGWGKIRPERPDPYFRMTQKNVRVVAWNLGATSADFGDIDGDGRPDVAVVVPDGDEAAVVKLFLNRGGTFPDRPDHEIRVPGVAAPTKLRLRRLNDDRIADFLVGGRSAALVLSRGEWPQYRVEPLAMSDANQVRLGDPDANGERPILVGPRFGPFQVARRRDDRFALEPLVPEVRSPYADLRLVDVNGDGRNDLVTSSGRIFLRREDGSFPGEPSLRLSPFPKDDWSFLGVGDFNADGRPDVALLDYREQTDRGGGLLSHGAGSRALRRAAFVADRPRREGGRPAPAAARRARGRRLGRRRRGRPDRRQGAGQASPRPAGRARGPGPDALARRSRSTSGCTTRRASTSATSTATAGPTSPPSATRTPAWGPGGRRRSTSGFGRTGIVSSPVRPMRSPAVMARSARRRRSSGPRCILARAAPACAPSSRRPPRESASPGLPGGAVGRRGICSTIREHGDATREVN